MIRRPYSAESYKQLVAAKEGQDNIDWVYRIGFGERRA
jgi:hypothetical protein